MPQDILSTAHALADAARPIALRYFRGSGQGLENKETTYFDPVTRADREIEAAMREILAARRPDDAILGEEFGPKTGNSGLTWVLDPIDGTRGFISGTPTWGVLVAVGPATGPTLGLLDQPFTGERFLGEIGPGGSQRATWRREGPPEPITVRPCADMADAVLFSTYPEIGAPQERDAFARVASQAKLTRYGLDCYAYGLCAAGQVDLVIEAGLAPYDIQAPAALVIAAGGIVTDWQGGPAHSGGRAIAAGDARVHAQALELLAWKN